jgi:hypothetical protein
MMIVSVAHVPDLTIPLASTTRESPFSWVDPMKPERESRPCSLEHRWNRLYLRLGRFGEVVLGERFLDFGWSFGSLAASRFSWQSHPGFYQINHLFRHRGIGFAEFFRSVEKYNEPLMNADLLTLVSLVNLACIRG